MKMIFGRNPEYFPKAPIGFNWIAWVYHDLSETQGFTDFFGVNQAGVPVRWTDNYTHQDEEGVLPPPHKMDFMETESDLEQYLKDLEQYCKTRVC